jgi:hypothetical protein
MAIHKGYSVYVGEESVYFEHITRGEDDSICVYHDSQKRVYDYDMSFCMIDEAREWLDANGYDTSDILG